MGAGDAKSEVTVAVVVNKSSSKLAPSETFLHNHINDLPCNVVSLIGNPGQRYFQTGGRFVPSQMGPLKALRWGMRAAKLSSEYAQDTRAFARFLDRYKVQAVLAEYGPTAVSVMTACRQMNIPLVAQFHGYDAYREPLLEQLADQYQQLFGQAEAVVGVSRHMCEQLLALGANPAKLFHNACGAEIDKAKFASPDRAPPRFLMVGRLVEKKAPFLAILAFSKVLRSCPDAELQIIGDGGLLPSCRQMVRALNLHDSVTFLGARPHVEVIEAMMGARAFIQHSVTAPDGDREGTPVGVLEALIIGLPVVSTRHGGIVDVVEDGVTGLLVDEYDIDAMSEAMIVLAKEPKLGARIGSSARAIAMEKFSSAQSVSRLWKIVKGAIEGRALVEPYKSSMTQ